MAPEPLWDHQQTAAYLGISEQALYWLNHTGKGPRRYKVGRYCRYRRTHIEAWLREQCAPAAVGR
ncbi:helix-turn-helix transcriptional regulator [Krasilnikovia sp. M28-CT-15]|uniref:helix-turn-helix transcriptional regulator n=1 Tax=Krasilnikovia sp. M28-CT-15 TaxID=3373540 RepID=UPI003876D992